MSLWLIGVVCARGMEGPYDHLFIHCEVGLVHYGVRFLVVLGFIGLCLEE
jgi:hypothetical protein